MNPNSEHLPNSTKRTLSPYTLSYGFMDEPIFSSPRQFVGVQKKKFPQPFVEQFDNKCNQKMKRLEFNEGFKQLARGNLNLFS